jgi:hypothetical protein
LHFYLPKIQNFNTFYSIIWQNYFIISRIFLLYLKALVKKMLETPSKILITNHTSLCLNVIKVSIEFLKNTTKFHILWVRILLKIEISVTNTFFFSFSNIKFVGFWQWSNFSQILYHNWDNFLTRIQNPESFKSSPSNGVKISKRLQNKLKTSHLPYNQIKNHHVLKFSTKSSGLKKGVHRRGKMFHFQGQ